MLVVNIKTIIYITPCIPKCNIGEKREETPSKDKTRKTLYKQGIRQTHRNHTGSGVYLRPIEGARHPRISVKKVQIVVP